MFRDKTTPHRLSVRSERLGLAVVVLGLGLVGCSDRAVESGATVTPVDAPLVVATTSILCDLTQQIAESTILLTCLMDPGQDPHTYQVTPSDRQALEQAALVLYDGYDYAPSVISMVQNTRTGAPQVAVYEAAVPNPLLGVAHDHDHGAAGHAEDSHAEDSHAEAGHDDGHSHGDSHSHDDGHSHAEDSHAEDGHAEDGHAEEALAEQSPDPHIWHSAVNNGAIVTVIAASLKEINPDQAELYEQNAARLNDQFTQLDTWITTQVATIPAGQGKLVTTHDSFRYFADAYGLEVKGALSGLSTEAKPTPGALVALVDQVKAAEVPAIFAETTTNPQLIETVAKNAGVTVAAQPLFVEGPGGPGTAAETTQAMLVVNTCTVVEALGGTCNAAAAPL